MRLIIPAIFVVQALAVTANAQTNQPRAVAPPNISNSPFGTDWARPYPETGGYIYNDPRLRNSYSYPYPTVRRGGACPPGLVRNLSGNCYRP
jgi:hypothetical protein